METQEPQTNPDVDAAAGADAEAFTEQDVLAAFGLGEAAPSDDAVPSAVEETDVPVDVVDVVAESATPEPSVEDVRAQYQAEIEKRDALIAEAAAERDRVRAEKRQLDAQRAEADWESQRQQALKHAETLDFDQAVQFLAGFFGQREQALLTTSRQTTDRIQTEEYRKHVIKQYGLTDDDAGRLGGDPYQFDTIARSMKSERDTRGAEMSSLRKELEQLKRAQKAQSRLNTGVDLNGGMNGQALPRNLEDIPLVDLTRAVLSS